MLKSIFLICLSLIASASADCTRDFLKNATDAYLAAQSGSHRDFAPALASNFTYTENDTPISITNGILSENLKIDHNLSIYDTTACATFTEIIVTNPAKPYVITTRMELNNSKVTKMESVVATNGDWAFNITGFDPIPEAKRDSRAVIKSVADAYFDRFDNASVIVPWGAPCNRLEGGALVVGNLTGDDCEMLFPDDIKVTNRRYVVDEVLGAVDIFEGFPGLDRSQGNDPMPDSHLFRVEGGKIRYIRTASHCVESGCGMNGTTF
ncbi:hypothetical protein V8E51_018187 [Hyaloscypha variabilis]